MTTVQMSFIEVDRTPRATDTVRVPGGGQGTVIYADDLDCSVKVCGKIEHHLTKNCKVMVMSLGVDPR